MFQVSENTELLLSICAQKGLHSQNYRCAECRTRIGFRTLISFCFPSQSSLFLYDIMIMAIICTTVLSTLLYCVWSKLGFCLTICMQHSCKSYEWIWMEIFQRHGEWPSGWPLTFLVLIWLRMEVQKKKKISLRQLGPLHQSSFLWWHFEPARVNPIKLAYNPSQIY